MMERSLATLAQQLQPFRGGLIAIDGQHGVGKTTLAKQLGGALGVRCVHLNDHLDRRRGQFVECLRLPELALALRDHPVLVEGVCMLAVMRRLEIPYDALVYVQETAPETRGRLDDGALALEVAAYHRQFHPEDVAKFFYRPIRTMSPENTQVDIAYINSRTKFAMVLAIGGMLSLFVGLAVLVYGVTGAEATTVKVMGMEVSAGGIGAVVMVTSALWAFFAYKARPQYARKRHRVETYDEKAQLVHREDRESSTQAGVEKDS